MIKIIDDFITKYEQDQVEEILLSDTFPWYAQMNSVDLDEKDFKEIHHYYDGPQLTHTFFNNGDINSSAYDSVKKMFHLDDLGTIIRCKANLKYNVVGSSIDTYNKPHYDSVEDHKVAIYYVNESDGDTWIFDENEKVKERISPKKGRMIFFDGKHLHAASHPIKTKQRCVINIDYKNE